MEVDKERWRIVVMLVLDEWIESKLENFGIDIGKEGTLTKLDLEKIRTIALIKIYEQLKNS